MRKVLLATTALVAMSVTAAQADVSISGQAVFEIYSPSTGAQTFTTDGGINITGTHNNRHRLDFYGSSSGTVRNCCRRKRFVHSILLVILVQFVLVIQTLRLTGWMALQVQPWISKAQVLVTLPPLQT